MPTSRRSPALTDHERSLGLRRATVPTRVGRIVVRAGRRTPDTTTATILLHGAAGSWTTWTPLLAASDRTGSPLGDVIIPDLPGWGESGDLPSTASVRDVSEAIIDVARALGYTSWRVVGHSLGGFVALDLAAAAPAATLSVALISPSGAGVIDAVRRPVRGGLRLAPFAGMLLTMRLFALLGRPGRAVVRLLNRVGALRHLSAPLFAHPSTVHSSVIDALAAEVRPSAFARAAALAGTYDTSTWRRITCPVGAVRGVVDVFAGAADAATFAAFIPGFHEVALDDAGHFAQVERPAAVLAVISALAGMRRQAPASAADAASLPARDLISM
ncbi:alpha/beta fold hydrolase [Microbacterium rhizomatis]|uniref:Alpha/beta hydrolase n=1 Tax=Microbacterium rhizomatis TaxID=1631477 RepID=A0A5J5J1A2_9MICO|nr:alpha/beta hydrolase [Microbacterium rhizomatis]KAA9107764.1 alpha/beta hydrolase [Microbacterium rhizomatis]